MKHCPLCNNKGHLPSNILHTPLICPNLCNNKEYYSEILRQPQITPNPATNSNNHIHTIKDLFNLKDNDPNTYNQYLNNLQTQAIDNNIIDKVLRKELYNPNPQDQVSQQESLWPDPNSLGPNPNSYSQDNINPSPNPSPYGQDNINPSPRVAGPQQSDTMDHRSEVEMRINHLPQHVIDEWDRGPDSSLGIMTPWGPHFSPNLYDADRVFGKLKEYQDNIDHLEEIEAIPNVEVFPFDRKCQQDSVNPFQPQGPDAS